MAASEPRWASIVSMGEAMVEFNQTGEHGGRTYLQGFGGDTSNFAVAAARQGASVAYMSALGDDPYGKMLRQLWDAEGIDHSAVRTDVAAFTAIYFVTHDTKGHHFHFFRKGSAASLMQPALLEREPLRHCKAFHFSGISIAISEQARNTAWEAAQLARESGALVTFDTNLRLKLWSIDLARENIRRAISMSDICLPSWDDMTEVTGLDQPEAIVDRCHEWGAPLVALKMGSDGALISNGKQRWRIPAVSCRPVDATGAGDTFGGAFVHRILEGDEPEQAGVYACTAAALSTEGFGAVEPIPRREKVFAHMQNG
jgi:2-dehydro-3-deoxygluconokinase